MHISEKHSQTTQEPASCASSKHGLELDAKRAAFRHASIEVRSVQGSFASALDLDLARKSGSTVQAWVIPSVCVSDIVVTSP